MGDLFCRGLQQSKSYSTEIPPTRPTPAPLPRTKQKPSPGTQPRQSTKLGEKSRSEGGAKSWELINT